MMQNRARTLLLRVVVAALAVATLAAQQTAPGRRIAVWGSSVANGTGDELRKEGYTGRLRELLAPRGWEVFNQSRGGDNTLRIAARFEPAGQPDPQTRYLTTVNPNYVLIGLSLGNEGIAGVTTKAEKDAVYTQFETGLRNYIAKSRERHIVPIVTLCYTRNDFTDAEYEYTRRMNLLINSWDVPSVNFLGAVDDGHGKWVDGFWNDALHPDASGHTELTTTFVPSLFEAIEKGKPLPTRPADAGFARITNSGGSLDVNVADTMHPFTLAFSARAQGDGLVAAIRGNTLKATTEPAPPGRGANGQAGSRTITTLTPLNTTSSTIAVAGGVWTYQPPDYRKPVASAVKADAAWHHIVLTHYTARGETLFYVDGKLVGSVIERFAPSSFHLTHMSYADTRQLDVKDLLIYRAGMNADEIAALEAGRLLQASLEVYAPLNDARFEAGKSVENRAQSLTPVIVGGTIARMDASR